MIHSYEVKTWLQAAMRKTPLSNTIAALAKRVTSELLEGQSERLAWLGNVGPMTKHEGELKPKKPNETMYSIMNEKFSLAAAIPGAWARADRTGQAKDRINQLGNRYVQWPGKLVASLIEAGFASLSYDGVAFFSASHVIGKSGTFSNLIESNIATPTAPTADEFAKTIATGIAKMWGQPDDTGEPFNEGMSEITICCHSDMGDVAIAALTATNLDTGAGTRDNVLRYSTVKRNLIASPRFAALKAANRICMFRTDAEGTPFIFQENESEHRAVVLDENSDHYKKLDEIVASVYAVGNGGYGNPQDALAITFT